MSKDSPSTQWKERLTQPSYVAVASPFLIILSESKVGANFITKAVKDICAYF